MYALPSLRISIRAPSATLRGVSPAGARAVSRSGASVTKILKGAGPYLRHLRVSTRVTTYAEGIELPGRSLSFRSQSETVAPRVHMLVDPCHVVMSSSVKCVDARW